MRTGLIVDYGGVMTTDVFASFRAFCEAEGLAPDTVRDRFRGDPEARGLLFQLETGELTEAQFEPRFAAVLEVESEKLIDRLFGGMELDEAMLDGVRAARRRRRPHRDALQLLGRGPLRQRACSRSCSTRG